MSEKEKQCWREIFELYRDMPCLWDISNSNYLNRDMRNQVQPKKKQQASLRWALFGSLTLLVDENCTISIFKKKLENMRSSYKRELKKVKASFKTGAGTNDMYVPALWYFDLLSFLDEKTEQSRRGTDTLENSEEEIPETEDTQVTERQPSTSHCKKKKSNFYTRQEKLYEMTHNLLNSPEQEWEIIGKAIGCQLKDLENRQKVIAQKLMADTLFNGKLGRLTEESYICLQPSMFSPPVPTPSPSYCALSPYSPQPLSFVTSPGPQQTVYQEQASEICADQRNMSLQTSISSSTYLSPNMEGSNNNLGSGRVLFEGKGKDLKQFLILKTQNTKR